MLLGNARSPPKRMLQGLIDTQKPAEKVSMNMTGGESAPAMISTSVGLCCHVSLICIRSDNGRCWHASVTKVAKLQRFLSWILGQKWHGAWGRPQCLGLQLL